MHILIVGGSRAERIETAQSRADAFTAGRLLVFDADFAPFRRVARSSLPAGRPRIIRVDDLERSFPNRQSAGTRLVLTQSTYLLQTWIDVLDPGDLIIATADRVGLEQGAKEAFERRGPWRMFDVITIDAGPAHSPEHERATRNQAASEHGAVAETLLARAYQVFSASERLRLCREAVGADSSSAAAALALASACRETQDLAGARTALDDAARLAPDWDAVHYEDGKFWLSYDDMERARRSFERAAALMPSFSAAWSNLGATLGELDEPEAALTAFTRALETDPESFTILNNIGVVNRELGRLDESEAALRQVVRLAPDFVFGHYNLGHTLLLAGKWSESLSAYENGQQRDPEKNRRQGCRLAMVRLANGDVDGAERELWRFANSASPDERQDLLLEAYEIGEAVMAGRPDEAARALLERLAAEITRSDL